MKKNQSFVKRIISSKFLRVSVAALALAGLLAARIQSESAQVINSEDTSIENVTVTSGYVAIVNGEEVAIASESDALATAFVEAKDSMSLSLSFEEPELEIVEKQLASTDLEETEGDDLEQKMEQAILSTTECEEYIYNVTVSGEETYVFALSSKEEIEQALNAVIAANTEYDYCAVCEEDSDANISVSLEPSTSEETVKLELLTSISVEKVPASEGTLVSEAEAEELLTGQYSDPVSYSIQYGDCFSSVADAFGITVDELLAMNEDYTAGSILNVGDILTIENYEDIIQFRVTRYYSEEEEIPYETEYIENDEWYDNVSETVVEGVNGTKVIYYEEVIENGETVSLTVLSEEVAEEAVNEQIEVGTIETPTYKYPVSATITSYYGERWGRMHKGLDFGVSVGTSVYASRGGTVIRASWYSDFGNCVEIQHSDGSVTRYAHLSEYAVSVGDVVSQGDLIAYSGNTGNTTGPHLHFEILINGVQVDPLLYLTK
ncbi:MAG: peptidoglycan DD-metalloendopeptidase family protein [Lachnospiraceae bacterium]|nr:peptidoglycan DD-metalloendopeptidase family protein [Lachnospiraceae bacterium]